MITSSSRESHRCCELDTNMAQLKPFADDTTALSIEELSLENGRDRVILYGNLELTRDKAGLSRTRKLKRVIDAVLKVLEAEQDLPDAIAPGEEVPTVKNPFA